MINLGTLKLFLTRPEYTELEGAFLALVSAPGVAPVPERLRILFGDLLQSLTAVIKREKPPRGMAFPVPTLTHGSEEIRALMR